MNSLFFVFVFFFLADLARMSTQPMQSYSGIVGVSVGFVQCSWVERFMTVTSYVVHICTLIPYICPLDILHI